jgi:nitroimidazol reductase NimA-like FMN-containing flavoprotein (pyridoxamine 5'-phosphate oxidase superfamily)
MPKYHMHKKEREMTDQCKRREILKRGKFSTIALCCEEKPYIITLNYGYDQAGNCLYFHTARKGLKLEFLRCNQNACATIVEDLGYVDGHCDHKYRSLVLWGKITLVEKREEKKHGMNVLLTHLESDPDRIKKKLLSEDAIVKKVAILRFDIIDICGKEHL